MPLAVRLLIAAAASGVLTFVVYGMTYGGMAPKHGNPVVIWAALALPLVIGAQSAWTLYASVAFAYLCYFVLV